MRPRALLFGALFALPLWVVGAYALYLTLRP